MDAWTIGAFRADVESGGMTMSGMGTGMPMPVPMPVIMSVAVVISVIPGPVTQPEDGTLFHGKAQLVIPQFLEVVGEVGDRHEVEVHENLFLSCGGKVADEVELGVPKGA